jgi:hypothetical protein
VRRSVNAELDTIILSMCLYSAPVLWSVLMSLPYLGLTVLCSRPALAEELISGYLHSNMLLSSCCNSSAAARVLGTWMFVEDRFLSDSFVSL